MEHLPFELQQAIVSQLPATIAKACAEQYQCGFRLLSQVLLNTRWMCIKKGITKSQYDSLVAKRVHIGGSWIEDLCWYGDLFYLEYVVKNLKAVKRFMPRVDNIELVVFLQSHRRLPCSMYDHIKDDIKSQWMNLDPITKEQYTVDLLDTAWELTFKWFLKNIFDKTDNYYGEVAKEVSKMVSARYYKMLKKSKYFDDCVLFYVRHGLFNKAMDAMRKTGEVPDTEYGLYTTVRSKQDVEALSLLQSELGLQEEFITIMNGDDAIYNKLLTPSHRWLLCCGGSRLYTKYTLDTVKYIKTLQRSSTVLSLVSESAYYKSYEAFSNIADLYDELEIPVVLSKLDCKKLHKDSKELALAYKLHVYPRDKPCFNAKTVKVTDLVSELSKMLIYKNIKVQSTGQVLCHKHIVRD